jgi:transcriptional regulator with XRE-family HTH domain
MRNHEFKDGYLAEFGHRLKLIRTYLKLDQKQLSELMNTAQSQISKIESGQSAPTVYQLMKIKEIAERDNNLRENLSWEWLLRGKGKGVFG